MKLSLVIASASFLGAMVSTQALGYDGVFCIFQRLNAGGLRVDAYRAFGYSLNQACYEAERQCQYERRENQSCTQYSAGEYGWFEDDAEILCESRDGRRVRCSLGGTALDDGKLYHQHSRTDCKEGVNWGLNSSRTAMWVSDGCRGDFVFTIRGYKDPENPPLPMSTDDGPRNPNGPNNPPPPPYPDNGPSYPDNPGRPHGGPSYPR